jgi:hypothetical protein
MKERRDEIQLSERSAKTISALRAVRDVPAESRTDGTQEDELPPLPPRRVKYPSSKLQVARWFYNSLIVLFLALMAGLFMLGHYYYRGNGG